MGLHKKTLTNIININILTRHKIYLVKRALWTSGAKGAGVQAPIAPPSACAWENNFFMDLAVVWHTYCPNNDVHCTKY